MPGKVNPVIPEVVNQVAFEIMGHDVTIGIAAEAGQLQLNAFLPIIGRSLYEMLTHLTRACAVLRKKCVTGIEVNQAVMQANVERSLSVATVLAPSIGYELAESLANLAYGSGQSIRSVALKLGHTRVIELLDQL